MNDLNNSDRQIKVEITNNDNDSINIKKIENFLLNNFVEDKNSQRKLLQKFKKELLNVIKNVLYEKSLKNSYISYYQIVKLICQKKKKFILEISNQIIYEITDYFNKEIKQLVIRLFLQKFISLEDFFTNYLDIINKWQKKLKQLTHIFLYLDKVLINQKKQDLIINYGLNLFIENFIFENLNKTNGDNFDENSIETNIPRITKERYINFLIDVELRNTIKDKEIIRNLTKIFNFTCFKKEIFLYDDLIDQLVITIKKKKNEILNKNNCFFNKALREINFIFSFFSECGFNECFLIKLKKKLIFFFFFDDFSKIMKMNLPFLIESKNSKKLKLIFGLCQKSIEEYEFESIEKFLNEWSNFIFSKLNELIQNSKCKSLENLIKNIADFYIKLHNVCDEFFFTNKKFEFELNNEFKKIINNKQNISLISFQLCKYTQMFYKFNNTNLNSDFDSFNKIFSIIFKFISNKTKFISIYKHEFIIRVILNDMMILNNEKKLMRSIFDDIKDVNKIYNSEKMFEDLIKSKNYLKILVPDQKLYDFDFSSIILNKKDWPDIFLYKDLLKIPKKMELILQNVAKQFIEINKQHENMTLDWSIYLLHQFSLKANFKQESKYLLVNLYQFLVLSLFNKKDSYQFNEILGELNMNSKILKQILSNLASKKHQILIQNNLEFSFNYDFKDKKKNIIISFLIK